MDVRVLVAVHIPSDMSAGHLRFDAAIDGASGVIGASDGVAGGAAFQRVANLDAVTISSVLADLVVRRIRTAVRLQVTLIEGAGDLIVALLII
jgi:hypothetical protein